MTGMPPGVPVDLELASGGYLRSPHGKLRPVAGLERIAGDALRLQASVVWGYPPGGKAGATFLWSRTIVLHPRVYSWPAQHIADVLSHELGHIVHGRSCDRARGWQRECYGDLLPTEEHAG